MSKSGMELRSSRSRSKTPFFGQELIEKEISASGNHVEKTVVRTTRRTTVIKSNESASSSTDEINTSRSLTSSSSQKPARKSTAAAASFSESVGGAAHKSERSLRSRLLKTSDYSSEDGGENEVTSTRTIRQNERNQLIENARAVSNGSDMPALELYRKSGRYWDVYPKTDWTYSHHSKDRIEIAPGVVAMPNMSRKTIHALDESSTMNRSSYQQSLYSENVSHKNTNTESTMVHGSRYGGGELQQGLKSRSGYNNNTEDYLIKRRTYSRWSEFKTSVTTTVTTIFTSIFSIFYYTYRSQTSLFSYIHRMASKVMLWDTYLLWKSRPGDHDNNKATKLVLLCLLPLLLFGGLWFLSSLGSALYGAVANYTSTSTSFLPTWDASGAQESEIRRFERHADGHFDDIERPLDDISESTVGIGGDIQKQRIVEEKIVKITEKVYMEPPSALEVAGSLTKEQLEAIALAVKDSLDIESPRVDTDEIVKRIVNNPSFVNVINNYYLDKQSEDIRQQPSKESNEKVNQQTILIDSLVKEIENMKRDIWLNNKHRSEDYARLSLDIKKCCNKRPTINIDTYVTRVVTDLLNNPEFLRNQRGLNEWLRTLFVAKQDLEYRLGNLSATMDSKMARLVESNSQVLMDKVAAKIMEISTRENHLQVQHTHTDEAAIKKIVHEVLAIYDADKTGLVDYAMETMGGQIVTTRCTEPYHYGKAVVSILGIPLWYPTNTPRTVITPTIAPGECWAFQNFPGFIVIKLSSRIKVDAFSMEHISRLLIPEGKIDSAPKEFEVYGLEGENDRDPVLLGTYKFNYEGDPLQYFLVEKDDQIFDMIEIRIVSNHGNPNYTCLYRFRVHGKVHHEQDR